MSIALSPPMIAILETLIGYRLPIGLAEEPRRDAATCFEADYVHRAGYRLGANGEWIARANGDDRGQGG
jgi:hypothetical protein